MAFPKSHDYFISNAGDCCPHGAIHKTLTTFLVYNQAALACETHKQNVTEKLITLLPKLYFETRKDASAVFNAVVRHVLVVDGNEQLPHVEHLNDNPNLLLVLLTASELGEDAVGNNAASLTYGTMLRVSISHSPHSAD